jgi:hypothetical protein
MHHLFRAFIAALLIVCTACSSMFGPYITVTQGAGRPDQAQIQEPTLEKFKECGELVQEGLPPGNIRIDAQIKADRFGRVVEATTTGEPNEEFEYARGDLSAFELNGVAESEPRSARVGRSLRGALFSMGARKKL